ncbi:ABC-type Fe3+-siderophore transport system, permease component [Pseudomonas asplenii]|uniref:ABC-type Fe3+-siderophore transport system, permease component n=1 Tax=Pseudomonas asplenii TaxID=53407 RepID=A0A0N0E1E5_9PSED|nr:ABC-type Fe3+-siderophore transport system, permease component [Pseudomonas fuscovaginae]KPA94175.1 ABC-type Fe3+-siderophore transport system, permease component [Pseudomonas fuscovaginae]
MVSIVGAIGFVGLVIPHALRLLLGPGHARLLPASALGGALLLVLADTDALHLRERQVQALPVTTLVALHDLNQALTCDRLAILDRGR